MYIIHLITQNHNKILFETSLEYKSMFCTRCYNIAGNDFFFHFLGSTYIVITSLDYTVSNREWWLSAVISAQFNNYWSPFDAIGYFLKCEGFVYSIVSEIFEMINMKEYWAKLFSCRNKLIIKLLNIEYLYYLYQ